MVKPQGRCIFCGGFGLSKEHLFADWLRELFPRTPNDTHTFGKIHWKPDPHHVFGRKQGHSGSRKVRRVCEICNNGWLSIIDDRAKYASTPLIFREPYENSTISEDVQFTLAAWFAKIAIVGDSVNSGPGESVVTDLDRRAFMNEKRPSDNWQVYAGYYIGSEWSQLAIGQQSAKLDIPTIPKPTKGYIQITCLGMGNLFALVAGAETSDFNLSLGDAETYMRRIWPVQNPIRWPPPNYVRDADAGAMSALLRTSKMVVTPK